MRGFGAAANVTDTPWWLALARRLVRVQQGQVLQTGRTLKEVERDDVRVLLKGRVPGLPWVSPLFSSWWVW
jgi:hypothetical protein